MRLSDLSTEDDDSGHCKMNHYDKKIDSLMNAVGCLKSEVRGVGPGLPSAPPRCMDAPAGCQVDPLHRPRLCCPQQAAQVSRCLRLLPGVPSV